MLRTINLWIKIINCNPIKIEILLETSFLGLWRRQQRWSGIWTVWGWVWHHLNGERTADQNLLSSIANDFFRSNQETMEL